jgi:hypothetical protein
MRITVKIDGDLSAIMKRKYQAGERAVSSAMRFAGTAIKDNWRAQITGAGLGQRLANTIRNKTYPVGEPSMNAASLVYSKAPDIVGAHDAGATIRSQGGFFLAVPLPAAGKARGGANWTPATWQFTKGIRLRFVRTPRGGILVADDFRVSSRGLAAKIRRKRRPDGVLTGAASVPIFALVRQVKLPKRLSLYPAAERIAAGVPAAIVANWRE